MIYLVVFIMSFIHYLTSWYVCYLIVAVWWSGGLMASTGKDCATAVWLRLSFLKFAVQWTRPISTNIHRIWTAFLLTTPPDGTSTSKSTSSAVSFLHWFDHVLNSTILFLLSYKERKASKRKTDKTNNNTIKMEMNDIHFSPTPYTLTPSSPHNLMYTSL